MCFVLDDRDIYGLWKRICNNQEQKREWIEKTRLHNNQFETKRYFWTSYLVKSLNIEETFVTVHYSINLDVNLTCEILLASRPSICKLMDSFLHIICLFVSLMLVLNGPFRIVKIRSLVALATTVNIDRLQLCLGCNGHSGLDLNAEKVK